MRYPGLIFGFVLMGCTHHVEVEVLDATIEPGPVSENNVETDTIPVNLDLEITYQEYVDQIPLLPAGFCGSCWNEAQTVELVNNFFTPEGAFVIGRMQSIENIHFILNGYAGDFFVPILEVYDATGELLYEQHLLQDTICGNIDTKYRGNSSFTIVDETSIALMFTSDSLGIKTATRDTIRMQELMEMVKW